LKIDQLRSYGVDPHYFGLGFIQLKINDSERIHFYHDELPVLVDEPHDHRYKFTSYIMQGKLTQSFWHFRPEIFGGYNMWHENCSPDQPKYPVTPVTGNLNHIATTEHFAGSNYTIEADTLHTVAATDNCITFLRRQAMIKEMANVVRKNGDDAICPFSQPISVDACWEMIAEMLIPQGPPKKANPGYHINKIPKGKVGEPSKIVEEALEIADAHEQGVKIMTQVEMSDLYGALDRYRERYHSELTMNDIQDMYRVTRRAFDNKKRK